MERESEHGRTGWRSWILKVLIRVGWEASGKVQRRDGDHRVWGAEVAPIIPQLTFGDVMLVGNSGKISHCAVYVGDGEIIHAMATESTGRSMFGAILDNLLRPIRSLLGHRELDGVIRERITTFFDRYERDTWVWLHKEGLSPDQRSRGVCHLESLVGSPYAYDFSSGEGSYYCSEVVMEFMEEAEGHAPAVESTQEDVPLLLHRRVIEPVSFLKSDWLSVIAANETAKRNYPDLIALGPTPEQAGG